MAMFLKMWHHTPGGTEAAWFARCTISPNLIISALINDEISTDIVTIPQTISQ
jgi:hypothetical protein